MKKRWIALLLAAVLPIGVLAGCGSEDMPELSLDSITAPVAAHNEMEVRTALGNYTGISEAAPDSADGEMAAVQFAGDASATTVLQTKEAGKRPCPSTKVLAGLSTVVRMGVS